jgi:hypothetical protein
VFDGALAAAMAGLSLTLLADVGVQLRFKESSQHRLVGWILGSR